MKNLKKILALVVAGLLVLSMTAALAAGSINLVDDTNGADEHEYKVYQIYTGTIDDGKLTNVKYGHNYGNEGSAVPKTELDALDEDGAEVAKDFASKLENEDDPVATLTKEDFSVTGLADGYYLIVDDTEQELADGDAFSAYILQVLGSQTNFSVKKDVPSSDKKITADDLGEDGTHTINPGTTLNNVSVGDTVTFTLTAKVPSHATDYDYYYFILNDTLDDGFTFKESDANITVTSTKEDKLALVKDTDYKVYTGEDCDDGHTFEIALLDAKSFAGKTITVTYKATLNENCDMQEDPTNNTYTITYSNNPNEEYDGTNDEDKPGKPNETTKTVVGETPEKTTETYTTGFRVKKVDQDGMPLKGVKFKINGTSLQTIVTYTEKFDPDASGDYYKLTNGSYTTIAPQTTDTMVEDDTLTNGNGYVVDNENGTITVGGVKYRVVTADKKGTHTLVKANSTMYADTTQKYKKTVKTATETAGHDVEKELEVGEDGILDFQGLGAGEYTVTETEAPQGYTKAESFKVNITFTGANDTKWTYTGTTDVDDDGVYYVQVVNRAGSTLPSTGGIGTTIFYVAGSILVLAAAILLITKRRMSAED